MKKRVPAQKPGGDAVLKKYGAAHFAKLGKLGGSATVKKHGKRFMRNIGKQGGRPKKDA